MAQYLPMLHLAAYGVTPLDVVSMDNTALRELMPPVAPGIHSVGLSNRNACETDCRIKPGRRRSTPPS